jgi:hypothetical protein
MANQHKPDALMITYIEKTGWIFRSLRGDVYLMGISRALLTGIRVSS